MNYVAYRAGNPLYMQVEPLLHCQCLTLTRQITMYLQTGIQRALCITQAETMPRPISPYRSSRTWVSTHKLSCRCRCTSPAAVPSDSTACLMTKASTGLTMIWNLPVICSLTGNFSWAAQASRTCRPASRQRQGQSHLICPNLTWEIASGQSEGGCVFHLNLCPYVNKQNEHSQGYVKFVHWSIQHRT